MTLEEVKNGYKYTELSWNKRILKAAARESKMDVYGESCAVKRAEKILKEKLPFNINQAKEKFTII